MDRLAYRIVRHALSDSVTPPPPPTPIRRSPSRSRPASCQSIKPGLAIQARPEHHADNAEGEGDDSAPAAVGGPGVNVSVRTCHAATDRAPDPDPQLAPDASICCSSRRSPR